jgi:TRAP-type C4-dicarboxylate transport system substrate-binding protein
VEVTKFYEVQKCVSTTRHAYSPLLVLASKKFWDQLSKDEQQVFVASTTSHFRVPRPAWSD